MALSCGLWGAGAAEGVTHPLSHLTAASKLLQMALTGSHTWGSSSTPHCQSCHLLAKSSLLSDDGERNKVVDI